MSKCHENESRPSEEQLRLGYEMMYAASRNDADRIDQLHGLGVPAWTADYDNRSALHVAAAAGNLEAVHRLLEHGADPNALDNFGLTPLDDTIRNGHHEVAASLRARGGTSRSKQVEMEFLQLCASNGGEDTIRNAESLLKSGLDPNCSDYDGRTPLHLAVAGNNVGLVRLLLEHGADRQAKDRWNGTPEMEAKRRSNRSGLSEMRSLFAEDSKRGCLPDASAVFFGVAQACLALVLYFCATYSDHGQTATYAVYQDVNVMVFIGFGLLMTFLRNNAYSSVGFTMFAAVLVIQWHLVVGTLMHYLFTGGEWHAIDIGLDKLVQADFAAGSVLVTYGALLGKVSPVQLGVIALVETAWFSLNESIGVALGVSDVGGSMVVHMFGAYFGMAVSRVLYQSGHSSHGKNTAVYHSDLFAMIGTLFLFMFWPSFNGAMRTGLVQQRVVVNTVLSLTGSCIAAFVSSRMFRRHRKLDMVDGQNAALAGGVAIGTAADMLIGPGAALATGLLAGVLSVCGFVYVQPVLESRVCIHDTCGVHNLHGIPAVLGAVVGAFACMHSMSGRAPAMQLGVQLAFILCTLGLSVIGGLLTGACVRRMQPTGSDEAFSDGQYWAVPELETP